MTFHTFLWPFDGDLSRFVQREGTETKLVSAAEVLSRTEPGSPDCALASGLKNHASLEMSRFADER